MLWNLLHYMTGISLCQQSTILSHCWSSVTLPRFHYVYKFYYITKIPLWYIIRNLITLWNSIAFHYPNPINLAIIALHYGNFVCVTTVLLIYWNSVTLWNFTSRILSHCVAEIVLQCQNFVLLEFHSLQNSVPLLEFCCYNVHRYK